MWIIMYCGTEFLLTQTLEHNLSRCEQNINKSSLKVGTKNWYQAVNNEPTISFVLFDRTIIEERIVT